MVLAAGAATLTGCAVASTIVAPRDEYSAYRNVRTANQVESRLKASSAYLEQYPEGRWRQDVQPWFDRAEAKYYARREETAEGLAEYLEVLPHGPHAHVARIELARHRQRVAEGAKDRLVVDARYTEARLALLAQRRDNARDTFGAWVGRLLSIQSWGQRTSELDHEFLFAWRIDKPGARCVEDRCSRLVELPFELPGGGEETERELDFEVVLTLRDGMLAEASLRGPGMFSRLYEAGRSKPVPPANAFARVQAIGYAVEFLVGAAEARLPVARCKGDAVGNVVLKRACDGWTFEVTAAEDPAVDDVVSVRGPAK